MSPVHYRVKHRTVYDYGADVVHAHQLLHLTPRSSPYQQCLSHAVEICPVPGDRAHDVDVFGNPIIRIELDRPHVRLEVAAEMRVAVKARVELDGDSMPWERVRDALAYAKRPRSAQELEASCYRMESPYVRLKNAFAEFAADCFPRGRPVLACADALMKKLHTELTYAPGETNIGTPLLDVLESRRGVCQDYSHLMIACLRSQGLSARYVSGYLRTIPRSGAPPLVAADASHAWVSVYVPPIGWVDLDPTNGIRVDTDHITLAWGRDFGDVSPLRGVIVGGGQHTLNVGVTVELETQGEQSEKV
jgi:transglutaminase-like putative cysteine protease